MDKWLTPAAIVLAGGLIAGAIAYDGRMRVIPQPWGYVVDDRWSDYVLICQRTGYDSKINIDCHQWF